MRARQWLALANHLDGKRPDTARPARPLTRGPDRQRTAREATAALPEHLGHTGASAAIAAVIAGQRGDWTTAEEWLRTARARSGADHPDDDVLTDVAEAALAHARGGLPAASSALTRLAMRADDAAAKYRCLWLPLRAEALVESGSPQDAGAVLAELRALAEHVPYLRVACGRLSGRLAERRRDLATARRHYETALELPPECLSVPFQVGLLEQSYGELLLGLGDIAARTTWLNRARTRFTGVGATPYAQRCAASLGPPAQPSQPKAASPALTDRERTVAGLVASGLTNRQTAARLYVSVKAIEYHLAQIYGKLGITSRRELRGLVEPSDDGASAPGSEDAPAT